MSYGTILVGRLKDAYLLPNVVWKVGDADTFKFYQCRVIIAETVFFKEEGHLQALCLHKEIVGIHSVENVVGEMECQFAFHSMGLA